MYGMRRRYAVRLPSVEANYTRLPIMASTAPVRRALSAEPSSFGGAAFATACTALPKAHSSDRTAVFGVDDQFQVRRAGFEGLPGLKFLAAYNSYHVAIRIRIRSTATRPLSWGSRPGSSRAV